MGNLVTLATGTADPMSKICHPPPGPQTVQECQTVMAALATAQEMIACLVIAIQMLAMMKVVCPASIHANNPTVANPTNNLIAQA